MSGPGGRQRSPWPLLVGLPLIVIVAVAAIYLTSKGGEDGGEEAASSGETAQNVSTANTEAHAGGLGAPSLGEKDAPVVMQEFADYQ